MTTPNSSFAFAQIPVRTVFLQDNNFCIDLCALFKLSIRPSGRMKSATVRLQVDQHYRVEAAGVEGGGCEGEAHFTGGVGAGHPLL